VFSQAELSGKQAELSGEEPYKGIILPLVKVLDYVRDLWSGTANGGRLYPKMLVTICVVHSPMVLVESPQKTNDPVLIPWLRVARQEAKSNKRSPWESSHQHYAIDVVHVDFFDSFAKDKLLPFAAEFFQRASRVAEILRKGGVVDDVTAWKWGQTITPIPRKTS